MTYRQKLIGTSQSPKSKNKLRRPIQQNRGFTLIEVLIASTLLAIGLLGHMSMASASLDLSRSGIYHTQATFLINQMAERMKNNPTGIRNSNYDNWGTLTGDETDTPCSPCNGSAAQAQGDKAAWRQALANFPDGVEAKGQIEALGKSNGISRHNITVSWQRTKKLEGTSNPIETVENKVSMIVGSI